MVEVQPEDKINKSIGTTKGDVVVYTGNATPTRLGIGTDTHVLTVDSSKASGVKWAAGGGGGGLSAVVDDITPQLGGDLEYNEKYQIFNRTLTSDNTASGDIIDVTFGETVVFGQICYPDATDNEWKLALATNVAVKHPAMGIALESKGNSETGKLLLRGTIRDATYFSAAVMGDIVYLSDAVAGSVVYTAPSDSGDIVQIVGFGLENNYIYFNPGYTYVEIS